MATAVLCCSREKERVLFSRLVRFGRRREMAIAVLCRWIPFLLVLLSPGLFSPVNVAAEEIFDVRQHLSTVTRYDVARKGNHNAFVASTVPDGCSAVHLNLVARHGTRSPTKKRIRELDQLAIRLDNLLKVTKETMGDNGEYVQKIPPWLWGWQSPWKGRQKGGELISQGEDELYHLGIRIREKFPDLFDEEYHPDIFNIRATQVPRASASAVAFGMGLFHGKGSLGPGRHRAFAVICESRASDIWLRFFDTCETYKEFRKSQEPAVDKLKEPILDEITSALSSRYHLNFTRQDISSLWFLCKQEASLLDITTQACGLFNSYEVSLLQWTDDVEVFILKGYGKAVNYHMGVPLLQDVVQSMEQAIVAKEESHKIFEKARLRFAHAETVVPFTCLLGLFLEGSEFVQIQHDQPLDLPPKPPQKRNWMGSIVAPFAGNNMLVLYSCSRNNNDSISLIGDQKSKYFVQVLHNEVPVSIPGKWDELQVYHPATTHATIFRQRQEEFLVAKFLSSLDDSLSSVCEHLLFDEKFSSLSSALSQVLRVFGASSASLDQATWGDAFAHLVGCGREFGRGHGRASFSPCTHCGRQNHVPKHYWQKFVWPRNSKTLKPLGATSLSGTEEKMVTISKADYDCFLQESTDKEDDWWRV